MSLVVWRIVQRRLAKHAFSGEGARRYGGRWNSPGLPVIYTAQSQSLAALEILVHVDSENLLFNYVAIPVRDRRKPDHTDRLFQAPQELARLSGNEGDASVLGDAWLIDQESVVLQVPSAVIPNGDTIFFSIPVHPDFRHLVPGKPVPFEFDSRLTKELT